MAKRFSTISSKINDIQQSCFDGDTQTLWCLTFNRFLCDLISQLLNELFEIFRKINYYYQSYINIMILI